MATEQTPLTSSINPGPAYVFPGVSPRSRRRHMRQFQCCVFSIFIAIAILALIIGLSYSNYSIILPPPSDSIVIADPNLSNSTLNGTELLNFVMQIKHPIDDEPTSKWAIPIPKLCESKEAENYGIKALGDREILEENLAVTPVKSAAFRHYRAISTSPEGRKLTKRGYVEYHATVHLADIYNYTKKIGRNNIGQGPKLNMSDPTNNFKCNFNKKYRSQNGMCNNKKQPRTFGAAMIPFRRAMTPDYSDGISNPRVSHSGKELPSARQVSLQIHRASYPTDSNFTVMLAVWGQFLDHDITATALNQGQDGDPIDCCTVPLSQHPECFPVPLVSGDPYYGEYNLICMNFVRSAPAPTGCFGPRQQLNQATSFIDGSVVYGNTKQKQESLRSKKSGQLRMYVTPDNRELLPISTNPNDGCNRVEMNDQGKYCFESGDDRANENLHLTSMHLIFARHHNYLSKNLQDLHPEWDDEIIFQEARRILGAQMQHITYNEFLPILLGTKFANAKGIPPDSSNIMDLYDETVNPSIANYFAAAAFRFAHTLIPGLVRMTRNNNSTPEAIELHKMLFNPYSLWAAKGINEAIDSAVNTPVSKVDQYFSKELSQKLFQGNPNDKQEKTPLCGLDLVSLNIQRGRDHGLPGYLEWRKHCSLSVTKNWEEMDKLIDPESLKNMKIIYETPDDIDLYTGALSEPPLEGAIFGPLLACLVSDQFIRTKTGDSYWFERKIGPQRFTKAQLKEIYKTTLAGIICQNSDNLQQSQKFVMLRFNNSTNPYVNCAKIKDFNFKPWSSNEDTKKSVKISYPQTLVSVMNHTNGSVSKIK